MEFNPQKLSDALSVETVKLAGVSRKAKVAPSYLSALKKGEKEPSARILGRIAGALGKPVDYFFEQEYLHEDKKDVANG